MEQHKRLDDGTVLVRVLSLRVGDKFKLYQSQGWDNCVRSNDNNIITYVRPGSVVKIQSKSSQWVILTYRKNDNENSIHGQSELIEGEPPTVGNN